jgi:hypothetical protein
MDIGTIYAWSFFVPLMVASYFVGAWLQKVYKERGK